MVRGYARKDKYLRVGDEGLEVSPQNPEETAHSENGGPAGGPDDANSDRIERFCDLLKSDHSFTDGEVEAVIQAAHDAGLID